MLTIYGVHRSRALRNLWLAAELGIPFEQKKVIQAYRLDDPLAADAPLNTRTPSFLAMNPMAQIPAIDDDGLVLTQSIAINLYLARKHGGPLAPADIAEEGQILMWSMFGVTDIETPALKVQQTHMEKLNDSPAGKDAIAVALRQLRAPFRHLDTHLARSGGYLVGVRFTVADINVVEVVRYAMAETGFFAEYLHIDAWMKACHARPHFQRLWAERAAE